MQLQLRFHIILFIFTMLYIFLLLFLFLSTDLRIPDFLADPSFSCLCIGLVDSENFAGIDEKQRR